MMNRIGLVECCQVNKLSDLRSPSTNLLWGVNQAGVLTRLRNPVVP
jgi:hypothetical protein